MASIVVQFDLDAGDIMNALLSVLYSLSHDL